jgi:hypothetical protein
LFWARCAIHVQFVPDKLNARNLRQVVRFFSQWHNIHNNRARVYGVKTVGDSPYPRPQAIRRHDRQESDFPNGQLAATVGYLVILWAGR